LDTWHAIGGTLAGEFAGWSDAAGIARIALRLLLALLLAAAGMGRAVTAILGTLVILAVPCSCLRWPR
jgi:hypothetical protein